MLRTIKDISTSQPAMAGTGLHIKHSHLFDGRLDPFLLLDAFSAPANSQSSGFPEHPHRGIQTLTYMVNGAMEHHDSMGTQSTVSAGGLQWMHSGKGILHSELPSADKNGLMGFQFWLNVPREEKYQAPDYQAVNASNAINVALSHSKLSVLAGDWRINNQTHPSPFKRLSGEAGLAELRWDEESNTQAEVNIESSKESFGIYVVNGSVTVNQSSPIASGNLITLGEGSQININATAKNTHILLFKGTPIGEPIVHKGPFVMTTQAEMRETIQAYQSGTLV